MLKVVFHVSKLNDFEIAYRNINNIIKSNEDIFISLLLNGEAIIKVLYEKKISDLILKKVEVNACNNSLVSNNINKSNINKDVIIVDSGVVELVLKQANGFAYIKP